MEIGVFVCLCSYTEQQVFGTGAWESGVNTEFSADWWRQVSTNDCQFAAAVAETAAS